MIIDTKSFKNALEIEFEGYKKLRDLEVDVLKARIKQLEKEKNE
jgi:hypothetical protein